MWWFTNKFKSVEKRSWEICFYAIIWSIWIERNDILFRNKAFDERVLVETIKTKIAIWLKACYNLKEYSMEDIKRCIQGVWKLKVDKIQSV